MSGDAAVRNRFGYTKLTKKGLRKMELFRKHFADLAEEIENELLVPSREKSLAMTKLEEASLWLNKAIAESDQGERLIP